MTGNDRRPNSFYETIGFTPTLAPVEVFGDTKPNPAASARLHARVSQFAAKHPEPGFHAMLDQFTAEFSDAATFPVPQS